MKFFPTVPLMAEISPTCSIIVAKAIGTIVMMEEKRKPQSTLPLKNRPNTVSSILNGRPNHAAPATFSTIAILALGSTTKAKT